jgi:hypothetical protein
MAHFVFRTILPSCLACRLLRFYSARRRPNSAQPVRRHVTLRHATSLPEAVRGLYGDWLLDSRSY